MCVVVYDCVLNLFMIKCPFPTTTLSSFSFNHVRVLVMDYGVCTEG